MATEEQIKRREQFKKRNASRLQPYKLGVVKSGIDKFKPQPYDANKSVVSENMNITTRERSL